MNTLKYSLDHRNICFRPTETLVDFLEAHPLLNASKFIRQACDQAVFSWGEDAD